MEKIRVKAAEGRRCKNPVTGEVLGDRPIRVTNDQYWLTRIKNGDCVLFEEMQTRQEPSAKPQVESKPQVEKEEKPTTSFKKKKKSKGAN